jgi:AP-1-like factor
VDELQKSSDTATQENGLLRAQVERLQVELREYRKRLSWMSSGGSGLSAVSTYPNAQSRGSSGLQNNEFLFDFPKFGDLPGAHLFNGQNKEQSKNRDGARAPGVLNRDSLNAGSRGPANKSNSSTPTANNGSHETSGSNASVKTPYSGLKPSSAPTQDTPTSDSPSSSSDSHQSQMLSSSGTSPEPSWNSPDAKNNSGAGNVCIHGSIDGEESFCARLGMACGNINNPIPAARDQKAKSKSVSIDQSAPSSTDDSMGFDWLAQQNGGQFDPVLFGDWREPQDAVLSQDFGSFFNDAFPLPDLGSPSHNLTEAATTQAPKKDLLAQIDSRLDEDEVVPGEDQAQMLSCTKIWYVSDILFQLQPQTADYRYRDRLQSMEKFRNGEIDVDNLCSELRTKARCSEGGVVVNQRDVDDIMGRAK